MMDGTRDRRAMGRAGQERVRRDFTFARQSARYQELFERLMNQPKQRRRLPASIGT
jgi:hypothetical protein